MKHIIALTICIVICFTGCDPELESRPHPSVETGEATDITIEGVTLNGEIAALGAGVKEYGFVFGPSTPRLGSSDFISVGKSASEGSFSGRVDFALTANQVYQYCAFAISSIGVPVYGEIKSFTAKGSKPPVITSVSPSTGFYNDVVTITGTGFSGVKSGNTVLFGSNLARVDSASSTMLQVSVPNLFPGTTDLKLTVAKKDAFVESAFTVPTMTITSFSPEFVKSGDVLTINGTNFPSKRTGLAIFFLGRSLPPTTSTPTQIKVTVPSITQDESKVVVRIGAYEVESAQTIKRIDP